ncbi:MAG: hypothetical protein KF845_01510 [Cyclobacteriaceae bacterium]|nr:hypothetical protein [Cyclobacteriaceae bacterium]
MRKSVLLFFLLWGCLLPGCKKAAPDEGLFEYGRMQGVLDNDDIDEASGLVASRINPGMLWTHNDSGDKPRIFLIDSLGRYTATGWLNGITNRDWEDIALGGGPLPDKTYLYIAEIGDNLARHPHKVIYRIEEPLFTGDTVFHIDEVDSIRFVLPDGARDAEALMIDPQTKDLYIFSKREPAVNLYRLPYPQSTTEIITAEKVLEKLPFTLIVAADWSADGKEILIKNYQQVYYWQREQHEPVTDVLRRSPGILPYHEEPQGESITFAVNGNGYYTLSERAKGVKPALMFYVRSVPHPQ